MKITKAQREALQWFAERDPVATFDRWAPTHVTRKRLEEAGLIEAHSLKGCFVAYAISDLGRAALKAKPNA